MIVIVIAMVMAVGTFAMTVAAARGSLAPNGLIGIRTAATQRSDAAWRAGHRAALPIVSWGSLVAVISGAIALSGALPDSVKPEAAGLIIIAFDVAMLLGAAAIAQRAAGSTRNSSSI